MIRESSRAVHSDNKRAGLYGRTSQLIIDALHGRALTRRELEHSTGLRPNQISGRVRELLDSGALREECTPVRCSVTGNAVKRVYVPEAVELAPVHYREVNGQMEFSL
jgi:hypothetical protein